MLFSFLVTFLAMACAAVTIIPLAVLVAISANVVAYENGHYDHRRAEPSIPPYHPEFHSQIRGHEAD
jgi:hypothetical protein